MQHSKGRQTVCFNIKASWHAIARMYNEQASKHGVTASVGYLLLSIDEENGTPATQLGPILGMESTSLSRMLKNLEDEELIVRIHDKKDKRLVKLFLTEQGKLKKEIAKKVVKQFNAMIREQISPEKLEVFFEVVEKINQVVSEKKVFTEDNI